MKILQSLSEQEILENPVWEYSIQEGIEYIQASSKTEIFDEENPPSIVLTKFFLHDKSEFNGFCSPADPSSLDYIRPVIIKDSEHFEFYYDKQISGGFRRI